MKLIPVALAVFFRQKGPQLEVWTQIRQDDGPYQGLWEFPGGKIEAAESPSAAVVREVREEVGIEVREDEAIYIGTYPNEIPGRTVLLYVFLLPDQESLKGKGKWLSITLPELSQTFLGQIPGPNPQIIDDLYRNLYSVSR